ncbi:GH3 family domain-containing protein [Lutibaculum baratangense]|uniref:Putative auxin-regulated protein n=1 Tax=Lutibaculum baratangense AMV1 TaxID=631454 RepID=V4R4E6_9HYPH|nr:GH3 auxin-responsive promoter family protein [Lutibaculum baratangense]ESR26827.1 putative auxin-regulated protein [Lutibaculum baratangense AMV1]
MLDATPFLRLYARWRLTRLSRMDPVETQRRVLMSLLGKAKDTRFGRDHGFADIRSVEAYQAAVPLRRYEDFWDRYWQPVFPLIENATWPGRIPYLAVTSGTSSGRTKYIPVSREMARANSRAGIEMLVHHLANRPESRVLGGKNFMLGGAVDLKDEGHGVMSGDLSGIARREVPAWSRNYIFPDYEMARESDWERKMEAIGRASLSEPIRTIAGTPSWLLLFFERLEAMTGKRRLVDFYPELELVSYGGLNFAPYAKVFGEWLEGSRAELREVYPASEGFIAVADRAPGQGMRMMLDNGLFFEFVPIEELDSEHPTRHWIGSVEAGREYAIALTSNAGVWSYLVGDTVRLVDLAPPRVLVTGRTSYFLSAFGEHLTGEEIDTSVLEAAGEAALEVNEYSVGARFPDADDARGRHVFVVEFRGEGPDDSRLRAFARALDGSLSRLNEDYEAHRQGDVGMAAPEILSVAPGTFADWMRSRGKLGGQNKVPRVINDPELLSSLVRLAETRLRGRLRA